MKAKQLIKGICTTTLIIFSFCTCKKPQESPALQVPKSLTGYWKVTEKANIIRTQDYRYDTFIAKTINKDDSAFFAIQKRNTYLHPWAGWSADTLIMKLLPNNIIYNSAQGNIGSYSNDLDTLRFKYIYGSGPTTVWEVSQVWIKDKSVTSDPWSNVNISDKPVLNDSIKSIIVGSIKSIINYGDTGRMVWSFKHGDYQTNDGILFYNKTIFFSTPTTKNIFALNYDDGNEKWVVNFDPSKYINKYPAIANGKLLNNISGIPKLFDLNTGNFLNDIEIPNFSSYHINHSPYVKDDVLYIGNEFHFWAIDVKTLAIKWIITPNTYFSGTPPSLNSMPLVFNGILYLVFDDGTIFAVNINNGQVKWKQKVLSGTKVSASVVANSLLYFTSNDSKIYAVDIATGLKKWEFSAGSIINSTPFHSENSIFFGSTDGKVYALDATTGNQKWTFATNDAIYTSPAVVNKVLYIISNDNNLYALDTETGKMIWYKTLPEGSLTSVVLITKSDRAVSAMSER